MATKTKRDFAELLALQTPKHGKGLTQMETLDVIDRFLSAMTTAVLKGDRIEFRDFGVFEPVTRKARIAQNPKTLEKVQVPERRSLRFKVGKDLKAGLRAPIVTA